MLRYAFSNTCKRYSSSFLDDDVDCYGKHYDDYTRSYNHQKIGHDLPYQNVYTKEEMENDYEIFFINKQYYEASILSELLHYWEVCAFDIKYCLFFYD